MRLLSHLYTGEDRVHVNDFDQRRGDRTEEFAYDIKHLKRGTVIGEVTAGGANPGWLFRLSDHFAAFIATGRAINPVTKTNWEGVGVESDVKATADEALKTAHVMALEKLQAKATDPEMKGMYERALESAKN